MFQASFTPGISSPASLNKITTTNLSKTLKDSESHTLSSKVMAGGIMVHKAGARERRMRHVCRNKVDLDSQPRVRVLALEAMRVLRHQVIVMQ